MRTALRLAFCQASWAPGALAAGWLGLGLASCSLLLLLSLGQGIAAAAQGWLGEATQFASFDVVPKRSALGPLSFAASTSLGITPLDERVLDDLAALPGVRAATGVVDLSLPMVAEGGEALLGRPLRADLLVSGIDEARVQAADAAAPDPLVAPFVDAPAGPVPMLLHPALLATYNATVAPSLGLPQLEARAVLGLSFTVFVGPSHLPGRTPVVRRGSFVGQIVGLSADAQPLGLSLPATTARRLWRDYVGEQAPPLASVRLQLCRLEDGPSVQRRLAKMGLATADGAAQLRAASVLATRLCRALGATLFVLAAGYALQALRAHRVASEPSWQLFAVLGHPAATLARARALQGLAVGASAALWGQAAALVLAGWLQGVLQRAADPWQLRLPQAFVTAPGTALAAGLTVTVAATWGALGRRGGRLDKASQRS